MPFVRARARLSHAFIPIRLLLAITCAAVGVGCDADRTGRQTPAQAAPPQAQESRTEDARPKVVCLGDSLTAGLGLPETQSYPSLLQKKIDEQGLRFEVVNAGVSGDTSAGGLRRLEWSLQDNARVLVLALGANDGLRGLPVAEMKENLAKIIETAQGRHIAVILAGMEAPPNYGPEYASSFRQAYRDLAIRYQVPFVPFLLTKVAGIASLNQPDGIHPNPEGASIVADTVWTVLHPTLERIPAS
jgi:acyl-CoA thioesterase-1